MFRVGIIGTENSHAMAFAKILNLPDEKTGVRLYPDVQVVMVYGPDTESAQNVMREANVPRLAAKPEDFLGNVDAMMITSRRGSVHARYALPFVEAGIPLFVDKPFTSNLAEAKALIERSVQKGSFIMGGSGCKYAADVLNLQRTAQQWKAEKSLISGSINFAADLTSEYDGFFFYSSHLIEMALAVFGSDIQEVQASENHGSLLVRASYPDFDVALHFTLGSQTSDCTLYGKLEGVHRSIDISRIYDHEVAHFVEMLHTHKMPQAREALALPVSVIEAILQSLKTGKAAKI
jgi:predicted dehydrogenase